MTTTRGLYASFLILLVLFLVTDVQSASASAGDNTVSQLNIIPKPVQARIDKGYFALTPQTKIVTTVSNDAAEFSMNFLASAVQQTTGFAPAVKQGIPQPGKNSIVFEQSDDKELGNEGYRLVVTDSGIRIRGNSGAGFFYAVQTLSQLLPVSASGAKQSCRIPCLTIADFPRFAWRGMHLDVSRHFLPKEFVKTYIDILAMHKMNVFHWHLTDDQGWRIEIKKYPRLTEVGAWRVDREDHDWNARAPQAPGEKATYGGFYTQEEIKEIVRYAEDRHITIIPEIEMPAHTMAALVAYPQFSCTGGPFTVPPGGVWPITEIYCAGNDSTFSFLQDVLTEVMDLFPGKYIHIGGDEADKFEWKKCPKCQARIKQEGLKDESELQSYFIKRIEKFLISKNRRLIGWDEILEGGLAPEATVMSWRGVEGGIDAARQGHDVVMTPGFPCYFNSYQGRPEFEPPAGGGLIRLTDAYAFEPIPDSLTPEQSRHVLGGQGCLWGEYIPTPEQAEYMVLPRLAAMAEVLWSPKQQRTLKEFSPRLEKMMSRYQEKGYNFAKSAYLVGITPVPDFQLKKVRIALATEIGSPEIRYTTDESDPATTGKRYTGPFIVDKSVTVRAIGVHSGKPIGKSTSQKIVMHKAAMKPVALKFKYNKYSGGGDFALTNALEGTTSSSDGNWQGFEQNDLDATVDLGRVIPITNITTHFLQSTHSWIFFPSHVEFEVSNDGKTFRPAGAWDIPVATADQEIQIKTVSQPLKDVECRYVRVFAKNIGMCPDWHAGRGGKAWLFVDEIEAE